MMRSDSHALTSRKGSKSEVPFMLSARQIWTGRYKGVFTHSLEIDSPGSGDYCDRQFW